MNARTGQRLLSLDAFRGFAIAAMLLVNNPGDWGHVYAPLLHGCTSILYEGKPVGTPDAGAFWRVIAEHGCVAMFTAPTAFRAIVNAHFKIDPPPDLPPITGAIGGIVEWLFTFPGRLSVTISAADHDAAEIEVSLIPETLARTVFGARQAGDAVNLEVDATTQAVVRSVADRALM